MEVARRSNYPVVAGITPTAGGVVFFGDVGGNFYALDSPPVKSFLVSRSAARWAAGVITYTANGAQKVAVAYGFSMLAWPVKIHDRQGRYTGCEQRRCGPMTLDI